LRDRLNPAIPNTRPPRPPNGLLHTLQRGADGTKRNRCLALTNGAWPFVRMLSHSSDGRSPGGSFGTLETDSVNVGSLL